MSDKLTKNENIRKTLLETREKRLSQKCKVFKIKINESRLSCKQKLERFANEMSKLLWQLRSRCPLADSFCQCETVRDAKHFKR